jgi:iron complex outermembrane receptor protein
LKLRLLALSIACIFTASPALAQDATIPEVVVTAQRVSTLESKTPVAMSVLSGEQLRDLALDTPSALGARLPNTYIEGAADGLKITIRGVTNADTTEKGDPSAAFMLDGVYIARPQSQNIGFHDIERIEVLRGPQGTLYGRNTTAGLVNVISRTPSHQFEAEASLGLGSYSARKASAMINVPVNQSLALRASLASHQHDSYLRNGQRTSHTLGLDRDDLSARLSAQVTFGASGKLLLRYEHSKIDDNNDSIVPDTNFYQHNTTGRPTWIGGSASQQLTNGFVPPNHVPEQGFSRKRTNGLGAELNWNFGPATLHYTGSQRSFDHDFLVNYYYRVAPGVAIGVRNNFSGAYDQSSHELRLSTNGSGPLSAQAGLYYFEEESQLLTQFRDLNLLGLPPYYVFPHGPTIANSKAIFGQATWRVIDGLRLTAGVRQTEDDKSRIGSTNFQQGPVFNPATDFKLLNAAFLSTDKATWRLGAEFDIAPSTLLYATISTGYKAGGFNDGCLTGTRQLGIDCPAQVSVPASTLFYQPEYLKSFEAGFKTRFFDKRATLNASAFRYDYTNLQLSGVAIVMGAPRYVTTNAGIADVKGLELDGQFAASPAGRLRYSLTLLDAAYVSYRPDGVTSWAGRSLDRAPDLTMSLGYEHRFALPGGHLTAGAFTRYSAEYVIGVPTQQLEYTIPSRTTTDLSLAWQAAKWSLQANVKNLENKIRPITIDSFGMTVPGDPRTVEVRFDYRF